MKTNMGSFDRIFRLLVAVVIIALYFSNTITGTLGTVLLVVSGIFVLTSIIGSCPLYSLVGINTCKKKE